MLRYQSFAKKILPEPAVNKKRSKYTSKKLKRVFLLNTIDSEHDNVKCQRLNSTYENI
jgi:hypothetical protein